MVRPDPATRGLQVRRSEMGAALFLVLFVLALVAPAPVTAAEEPAEPTPPEHREPTDVPVTAPDEGLVAPKGSGAQVKEAGVVSPDDLERMSLEELLSVQVTTATKSERTLEQAPSIVTVFRREDIDRLQVHQLVDLLKFVPGFYEVAAQLGRNVAVRGIHATSAQHFMVLLDGQVMNDFLTSTASPDAFTLDYAERVEILRGPASSIYGASALMAVVNIITHANAEVRPAKLRLSYGTDNTVRASASAMADLGRDRTVAITGTFWSSAGSRALVNGGEDVLWPTQGQNLSDGIQPGENLSSPLANAHVNVNRYGPSFDVLLRLAEGSNWDAHFNMARSDFFPQRTYRQGLIDAENALQPTQVLTQRVMADVGLSFGEAAGWGRLTVRPAVLIFSHELNSQGIAQSYFERAFRENEPVVYGFSGTDARFRVDVDYQLKLADLAFLRENTLQAGVQGEYNLAVGYTAGRCFVDQANRYVQPSPYAASATTDVHCLRELMFDQGLVIDPYGRLTNSKRPHFGNGDEVRLGAFLQLSTFIQEKVGLVIGGRFDHHLQFGPSLSPRVSVVLPLVSGGYAKAQYARAFVYPAFLYTTTNALSEYEGQANIKPQSIDTFELLLGLKKGFLRAEVNGYLNQVHDFITFNLARNAQTGRYIVSNQGKVDVLGLEASVLASLFEGRLALNLGGSFAKPLGSTDPAFLVNGALGGPTKFPTWMGTAIASYSPWKPLAVTGTFRYNSTVQSQLAPQTRFTGVTGTDGLPISSKEAGEYRTEAAVFDVGATLTWPTKRWRFSFLLTNLTDERYYQPGAVLVPYLAEGRRLTGSVAYDFE
jgi:outer membrane cobalamin receptor